MCSVVYYYGKSICPNLDWINIMGFDFQTPKRNPKEADYPAPLYELIDRHPQNNLDFNIRYWYAPKYGKIGETVFIFFIPG